MSARVIPFGKGRLGHVRVSDKPTCQERGQLTTSPGDRGKLRGKKPRIMANTLNDLMDLAEVNPQLFDALDLFIAESARLELQKAGITGRDRFRIDLLLGVPPARSKPRKVISGAKSEPLINIGKPVITIDGDPSRPGA